MIILPKKKNAVKKKYIGTFESGMGYICSPLVLAA
jgi:hypothetical protein